MLGQLGELVRPFSALEGDESEEEEFWDEIEEGAQDVCGYFEGYLDELDEEVKMISANILRQKK